MPKITLKKKLPASLLLLTAAAASLPAITADEILAGFAARLSIPTVSGTLKLRMISKKGDVREVKARAYQKTSGSEQVNRTFIVDFPPTVRGTGLLLHSFFDGRKNSMWMYLPAVRRIKRIALESAGGGYFMGSDFTFRDLINTDYDKMDYELLKETSIDGVQYYVIKAWGETVEIQQENGYSFLMSYYRKSDMFMMKREYFDFDDELLKVYQVQNIIDMGPYVYPSEFSMTNVQSGHKSLIEVTSIDTEDIPDRFFTTRYLQNN